MMNLFKKAAVSLAATTMILAPVAASAAPALASFDGARAVSATEGQSDLEGSTSWIIALIAIVAIIGGIVVATGNNDDNPTSP